MDRRPLKVRSAKWAHSSAAALASSGVTPNHISLQSVVFAILACGAFYLSRTHQYYLIAASLCVQLRLICNLLDGMVAVEHQQSSPNGELYNDVPDRFADVFIIVGAALAIPQSELFPIRPLDLAWLAAVVAVITAYVRVLGRSLGTPSHFFGPMAKQHRMFLITVAALIEVPLRSTDFAGLALYSTLVIISVGGLVTAFRRLDRISQNLMGERND